MYRATPSPTQGLTPPDRAYLRRRRRALTAVAATAVVGLAGGATALALPAGLKTPTPGQASQIDKFTGYTSSCLTIAVDETSPKWAYMAFQRGSGCPAGAHGFPGFIIAYENAPQNTQTAGFAWDQVLKTAHPQCPLAKVPASVAKAFEICTGSGKGPGKVPHL